MSIPLSLKQNYFSLGNFSFSSILSDDYPHKKFETETIKATTQNNNTIHYKTECQRNIKEGKQSFEIKDELKFGYNIWEQIYLQTRVKRDGEIKYHLDFGNYIIRKHPRNLFATIKTDTNFSKFCPRVGFGMEGQNYLMQSRIEKNYAGEFECSSMANFQYKEFFMSFNSIQNIVTQQIKKFNASINFKKNSLDLTLQHLAITDTTTARNPLLPIGNLLVAAAYKFNNQYSLAAWFKKNLQTKKQRFVFGIQCQPNNQLLLKAKTDCKGKTSMSFKFKLAENIGINIGTQLSVVELVKEPSIQKIIQIPIGYSLDVNI